MAGTLRSWLVVTLALAVAGEASAAELRGSKASMQRQNSVAQAADLTFLRTSAEVDRLVVRGALEPVYGGRDYVLANVSHPYAQPEVRLFVERLAAQYRQATGEALVVTSLTRPAARQPGNAHTLSVHPAGMAVDLRVPAEPSHREWLEETLLGLEAEGLVDVTRERSPPHYHIAVFPAEYRAYVDRLDAAAALTRAVGGQAAAAAGGVSEGELAPARGSVSAGAAGLLGIAALAAALALGLLRGSFPRPLLATDS
ncbi:MAG TPA: DUF5715 family protein, partial [Longimicrobiales bacterium]|nr:DUF5715 family protein [Longimicrobiales bacterium]